MRFLSRPLAITDIETTGLDAQLHEIIELALLLVDPKTLKILDRYTTRIKPKHIEHAAKRALEICGYNEREWRKAVDLELAMTVYAEKTKNALFCTHNVFFDWSFLAEAFKRTRVEDLTDYHCVDIFSATWSHASKLHDLKEYTLESLCRYFRIPPEPRPHRALNGAKIKLALLKELLKHM